MECIAAFVGCLLCVVIVLYLLFTMQATRNYWDICSLLHISTCSTYGFVPPLLCKSFAIFPLYFLCLLPPPYRAARERDDDRGSIGYDAALSLDAYAYGVDSSGAYGCGEGRGAYACGDDFRLEEYDDDDDDDDSDGKSVVDVIESFFETLLKRPPSYPSPLFPFLSLSLVREMASLSDTLMSKWSLFVSLLSQLTFLVAPLW